MGLRARVKDLWERKVVGCWGHSDDMDNETTQPKSANYVSSRNTSRTFSRTQLSATCYILLLTSALITPGNCHPPLPRGGPQFGRPALAESRPESVANEPEHLPAGTFQRYTHSQTPRADAEVQAMNESAVYGSQQPEDVQKVGDAWIVAGVGSFDHRAVYKFTGDILPQGLGKSDYTVQDTERNTGEGPIHIPHNHRFDPDNVQIHNGTLHLKVPGRQSHHPIENNALRCAEIATRETKILYASVRTRAMFSREPGTCHGMFFYSNDQQETDIEYLSDARSLSNNGPDEPIPIWYSNQAVDPEAGGASQETGPAPSDVTSRFHDYRIDWTAGFTAFYIDGVLQKLFTENIPSVPGPWVWNNWANGDRGWSYGPPEKDNDLKIESIVMYYNTKDNDE